jgi:hypothetical protein
VERTFAIERCVRNLDGYNSDTTRESKKVLKRLTAPETRDCLEDDNIATCHTTWTRYQQLLESAKRDEKRGLSIM